MATRLYPALTIGALLAVACGAPEADEGGSPGSENGEPSEMSAATSDLVRTADPAARGYTTSDFPRVQELAPGVYTYEHLGTVGGEQLTTVSFFVVTDEGVLVADGQATPEATQQLIAHIREVTDQPITTVVIGSDHGDHTGGNSAFPDDATFVVHPTSLAALEQREMAPANVQTVDDEVTLTMGGREIRVLHLGRAHTGGDLVVHLPEERILFMSETFFNRVFPTMRTAYPEEWVETLERAQAMDIETYVPGHGFVDPPEVLEEELQQFKGAIEVIIAAVEIIYAEGASVEDALNNAALGDLMEWTRASAGRDVAIERVYADLSGALGGAP